MTGIRNVGVGGAFTAKPQSRKATTHNQDEPKSSFYPRRRARENVIPSPDELAHLINNALKALTRGVYWDRGSILNIKL